MPQDNAAVVVYSTCPDEACARTIATRLVSAHLAACVNIIPGMVSVYRWDGKVTSDNEVVLIIKSQQSRVDKIIAEIESNHPYDVPAAVVLPVTAGSKAYLSWLLSETDAPTSHAG